MMKVAGFLLVVIFTLGAEGAAPILSKSFNATVSIVLN